MKTIIALLLTTLGLFAQTPIYEVVYSGGTNRILAATNLVPARILSVQDYRQLGIYSQYTLPAGTNGYVTLAFHRSFDNGVTYESNAWFSLVHSNMSVATNVDLGAANKIKFATISNGNTNYVTNLYVVWSLKK